MAEHELDNIALEQAGTLYGLFQERVSRTPNNPAYRSYDSDSEEWVNITWQETATQVARWQQALKHEGLEEGDTVALNLKNSKEWVFFDQAALGLGLIVVPLYPDDRPDNVAYILNDADVKLVFLQNAGQWKRLAPSIAEEHALKRVIIFGEGNADDLSDSAVYANNWLPENWGDLQEWDTDPHKLASIIYTSGTTGRPKGVMLSHHNMLSVAAISLGLVNDIDAKDTFLSFLPLSHTLERTAGYYLPMMAGSCVAYARGIAQLSTDLLNVKPTIMIAVPRIFERIYVRLQDQMTAGSSLKKTLFHTAMKTGWTQFQYDQKQIGWRPGLLLNPVLNKLVGKKVQDRLGGNLRLVISGGAALPAPVAKMFIGLGFCLLQGYGLTETSPMVSVNTPKNNDPTSVGPALPGVGVMIGENDELLVRGPGNMLGYWNNHKATAQVIDARGWLHTGDQAKIEENGRIHITGRIKDILVLSNGEKVPPGDIENAILLDSLFEQALVIGEGENFLAALLVLNQEKWVSYAKQHSCDPFDAESLNNKEIHASITKLLRELLHDFPAYARIRKVALTLDPWEIDSGLMTPTMKIKRPQVMAHHKADVENIYS